MTTQAPGPHVVAKLEGMAIVSRKINHARVNWDNVQGNVEADESNLGVDSRDIVGDGVAGSVEMGLVETDGDTDNSNDELADEHTESTIDEERASTNSLHSPEGERCGADVDQIEDEGDQEGVADGTGGLQERSRVVEDEVDTGPLLHHLERSTQDSLADIGVGLEERSGEAVQPRSEVSSVGNALSFVLGVGDNLGQFSLNVLGLDGLTTETGKNLASILNTATLDVPSR